MRKPVLLTGSALALLLAPALPSTAFAACNVNDAVVFGQFGVTTTFNSPGSSACYVVPAGVTSLQATVIGGRGGAHPYGGPTSGGRGAIVTGRLPVTPGQELMVVTGANGISAYGAGSTGGGLSRVDLQFVAGGGGGAGGYDGYNYEPGGRGGDAGAVAGAGDDDTPARGGGTEGKGGGGATTGSVGLGGLPGYGNWYLLTAPGANGFDMTGGGGGLGGYYGTGSGGQGGAGYYGGGGGGGGGADGDEDAQSYGGGGGGGAGSSYAAGWLDAEITTDTAGSPLVELTAMGPVISASPVGVVTFPATQPLQTVSPSRAVTITNTGTDDLRLSGLTTNGTHADDFFVSGDTCRAVIAPNGTCVVNVRFWPQAPGARTATLEIAGNLSASIPLAGTGGALTTGSQGDAGDAGADGAAGTAGTTGLTGAAGATGSAGVDGAAGPAGPAGATGRAGRDASTSCVILTTTTQNSTEATGVLCTVTSVASRAGARATLSRHGRTIASGIERKGTRLRLRVRAGQTLSPGKYRLARSYRQANRTITERRQVTIR